GTRLPRVLPIVLCNGTARWLACRDISELIEKIPSALDAYCPSLRYLLIDERAHHDSEVHLPRNLVASLFKLQSSRTYLELDDVAANLFEWLITPDQLSLRRAFKAWLNRVIVAGLSADAPVHSYDLEETRMGLVENLRECAKESRREGGAHIVLRVLE